MINPITNAASTRQRASSPLDRLPVQREPDLTFQFLGKAPSTLPFPAVETNAGDWRGTDAALGSRSRPCKPHHINNFQSVTPSAPLSAQNPGIRITTHCLNRINHLRVQPLPCVVHCGQRGIRCAHCSVLASSENTFSPPSQGRPKMGLGSFRQIASHAHFHPHGRSSAG